MFFENEPLTPSPRDQVRVLFVCWGNICRSPMAEFIMKDLVKKAGREKEFYIESAAHSREEIGNGIYPPAKAELKRHGIGVAGNELGVSAKTARQIRKDEYRDWDYIIGMEQINITHMMRILEEDPEHKVHLLMDFTGRKEDIDDPWYTGDFAGVYQQILEGCQALLEQV